VTTYDQERIFCQAVRAIAEACRVTQFRCQVLEYGQIRTVFAVGQLANEHHCDRLTDGRCGPGGAAALLRSLAMVSTEHNNSSPELYRALRHAASRTFNTDEEFDRWIGK
jgi:hypothetical protein